MYKIEMTTFQDHDFKVLLDEANELGLIVNILSTYDDNGRLHVDFETIGPDYTDLQEFIYKHFNWTSDLFTHLVEEFDN